MKKKNGKLYKRSLCAVMSTAMILPSTVMAAVEPQPTYDWQVEHQTLARQLEEEAILLLKNEDDLLPLDVEEDKIAVFGTGQLQPPTGGGSGGATGAFTSTLMDGLNALEADYYQPLADYIQSKISEEEVETAWGVSTTTVIDHGWDQENEYPDEWGENASSGSGWNRTSAVQTPEIKLDNGEITDDGLVADASEYADTAIVYLSRSTGVEEMDRNPVPQPGDWYLNASERILLEQVNDKFENIVLIYTGTAPIDMAQFEAYDIDAFLVEYGAGQFHGLAMADILFGNANPSAKLNDTLTYHYEDHPTAENFGYTSYADKGYDWEGNESKYGSRKFSENDPISAYEEYIYMGYRYFDTFNKEVAYPFGFGLSYSDFTFTDLDVEANQEEKNFTVSATIKNESGPDVVPGKEVMEVYVSKPQGDLEQAYQNLVTFGKTEELASGEEQRLELDISFYEIASYDEELAAYVLEPGEYIIRVGNSSRNTHVAGKISVAEEIIVEQLSNQLSMQEVNEELYESRRLKYADADPITYEGEAEEIASAKVVEIDASYVDQKLEPNENPVYTFEELPKDAPTYTFQAVVQGEITLEQFVTQLTDEELAIFLSGGTGATYLDEEGNRDPEIDLYASDEPNIGLGKVATKQNVGAGTSRAILRLGIPSQGYADGGSGTALTIDGVRSNTGWIRPAAQACTWNTEGLYQMGVYQGEEMILNNVDNWLAPSINLHRNPLVGRNQEYWSEDPILSGKGAAALASGVAESGVSVCLKHFVANDQEWFRRGLYTLASEAEGTSKAAINVIAPERVLREIYLKPFEIAVKTGDVYNVMSAFNSVNSQACAGSPELLTNILRGEWGFEGFVVTDWGDFDDIAISGYEMLAGNDMIMSGTHTRYSIYDELVQCWEDGLIDREVMLRNAYNVLNRALNSSLATDPSYHNEIGDLAIVTTMLVNACEGQEYSLVKVNPLWANSNLDTLSYTFSLDESSEELPEGITLAPNGQLSGVPAVDTAGDYNLVFKVTDDKGNTATKALTLTVDPEGSASAQAPTATEGSALENEVVIERTSDLSPAKATYNYTETYLEVSGAGENAVYEITDGSLPTGMILEEDGRLWGQPAAESSGIYSFTVTATDGDNQQSATFELYVEGALTVTPAVGTVFTLNVGEEFTQSFTISDGFSNLLTKFEVSDLGDSLPEGLEISFNEDGAAVVSGTPAEGSEGTYDVYFMVDEEFAGSPVWSYAYFQFTVE